MTDILGKEIVGYEESLYLKSVGFNNACTGYYHIDENLAEKGYMDEDMYECVGWRGLFKNSFSLSRAAAPSVRAAKIWYTKNKIKPFNSNDN